jgi:hypothetical protein
VLCLVEVADVEPIVPLEFDRKKNMDDWFVVEKIDHILKGSEHEYKNIRVGEREKA